MAENGKAFESGGSDAGDGFWLEQGRRMAADSPGRVCEAGKAMMRRLVRDAREVGL